MLCLVSFAHRVLGAESLYQALDPRAPGSKVTVLTLQFHWSYEEALCSIPWIKMAAMGRVQRCHAQHCGSEHTCASPEGTPHLPHSCWCCSVTKSCLALCNPMDCGAPSFPVLHHLPWVVCSVMSIESVMPSNHLILCHPLLLPSIFPRIRFFSNE